MTRHAKPLIVRATGAMGRRDGEPRGSVSTAPGSRRNATVIAWVLPHMLAYVAARGHDATSMRAIPGLRGRDLDDPDMRIADAAAAQAWRLAGQITGDDAFGLHLAQWVPAGALDVLEYAFRSSPTLGSALEQMARYSRAVSARAEALLAFESEALVVTWGEHAQAQRVEFAFALLVRLAREATGTPLTPIEVRYSHRPPEDLLEHRAFFRAPVHFGQPSDQLLWTRADLARPLRSADPGIASLVRRRLEKLLTQVPPVDDSTSALVRRTLLGTLSRAEPTAAAVARELGSSARTLHRRLRAEGQTFRGILEAVRGELARDLLREPAVGIAEIAFVLGYSEPAAFHRFFRRWSGHTPVRFRRASRSA